MPCACKNKIKNQYLICIKGVGLKKPSFRIPRYPFTRCYLRFFKNIRLRIKQTINAKTKRYPISMSANGSTRVPSDKTSAPIIRQETKQPTAAKAERSIKPLMSRTFLSFFHAAGTRFIARHLPLLSIFFLSPYPFSPK